MMTREAIMKFYKISLISLFMIFSCIALFNRKAVAYEATDVILDDEENTMYMTECVYTAITSFARESSGCNIIYEISLSSNDKKIFSQNTNLTNLALSPNANYVSVLKGFSSSRAFNEMLIIDKKEKKEVATFKDEFEKYKWSPDSKKLIYITRKWTERGDVFVPQGVWRYDIEKGTKKKIADRAMDIEWLPNDNIYIIDSYIRFQGTEKEEIVNDSFIYSYKDNSILKKNVTGLKFSLDGIYSIALSSENIGLNLGNDENRKKILVDIYDLRINKKLSPDKLANIFNEPERIVWTSLFWAAGNKLVYWKTIGGEKLRDICIADIEKNRIIEQFRGIIAGVNNDRSKLVVFVDGKFKAIEVPELGYEK